MNWISVIDKLPPENNNGVHDAMVLLVKISDGTDTYNGVSGVRIDVWINSTWYSYPQGATDVTHWCLIEDIPE